jgi:hypothetical protein
MGDRASNLRVPKKGIHLEGHHLMEGETLGEGK